MNNYFELNNQINKLELSILRNKDTNSLNFRRAMKKLSFSLAYEMSKELEVKNVKIETPITSTEGFVWKNDLTLVSIMRAGNGLLDGFLEVYESAKVCHIGLARQNHGEHIEEYYFNYPKNIVNSTCFVLDPMLATGSSVIVCIDKLKKLGVKKIFMASILSTPEGILKISKIHPDVLIYTIKIDDKLNELNYIVPGLGDAGDRYFNSL